MYGTICLQYFYSTVASCCFTRTWPFQVLVIDSASARGSKPFKICSTSKIAIKKNTLHCHCYVPLRVFYTHQLSQFILPKQLLPCELCPSIFSFPLPGLLNVKIGNLPAQRKGYVSWKQRERTWYMLLLRTYSAWTVFTVKMKMAVNRHPRSSWQFGRMSQSGPVFPCHSIKWIRIVFH